TFISPGRQEAACAASAACAGGKRRRPAGGKNIGSSPMSTATASPRSFAALRIRGYQAHFSTYLLAMMADNIEHVISYWMAFQKFHSPALGGFAVVSHWLPFLLFSVPAGALADRFDPRRIIQCGMALFILAS